MRPILPRNLIARVSASVVMIEIIFICLAGAVYFNRFAAEIDARQAERLHIASELIRQDQLNLSALTDRNTMSLLMGEEIQDAMLISSKGIVAFSLDPAHRRKPITDISFLDKDFLKSTSTSLTVKRVEANGKPYLASSILLPVEDQSTLILYFRIGVASGEREKRAVLIMLLTGLVITAIATSAALTSVLNRIVLRRVSALAQVAQKVQAGDLSVRADFHKTRRRLHGTASTSRDDFNSTLHPDDTNHQEMRVESDSDDEIGILARALNAMTDQLRASIHSLEQRLSELDRTSNALKESEERYRLVFENSPVSIWEEDFSAVKQRLDRLRAEGVGDIDAYLDQHPATVRACADLVRIVDVNQAAVALVAAQHKEVLLEGLTNTFTPEAFESFRRQLLCLWNGQTELIEETTLQPLQGAVRHVTIYFSVCPGYETTHAKVLVSLADISERKHAEEEVRRINQELEHRVAMRTSELQSANKELESFSYSVSHDLRTPLRHIDGYLSLLKESAAPKLDEEDLRHIDTIASATRRMSVLIDDLLSFSRMGRQEMRMANVSLGGLVADVVQAMEPETKGRNIDWHIADLPVVTGDRAMLRVVLDNLISNALKYSSKRPQARIEIGTLPAEGNETVVYVRDNGAGFDMKYRDKLFGVFQRLHRIDEFDGTGIGLANVLRIVSRHGGRCWAEGKPDEGATFYVALPKAVS